MFCDIHLQEGNSMVLFKKNTHGSKRRNLPVRPKINDSYCCWGDNRCLHRYRKVKSKKPPH